MYLHQKKNDSQKHTNSLGQNFPIDLLTKTNNQYKYNNKMIKSNNYIKYNGNNNISKNINTSINNKSIQFNKKNNINNSNYIHNHININNSHIIKNNNKSSNQKQNNSNFTYINKSISHNNKNKNANPINTYIINTLNVSEKEFLSVGIPTAKPQKSLQKISIDFENEINKLIKEKEDCENIIKKQERLIEKLVEDNEKLDSKIKNIQYENKKINQKIEAHRENQEQLIMLIKIIQKSGVDVEELIDKWNNEVEMENNNNELTDNSNNSETYTDSINELNSKIDPSSFIPINIEEPHINKKVFNGIPKLNFDILKNNRENNRKKFRNNSK